jgi:hypothetical protein
VCSQSRNRTRLVNSDRGQFTVTHLRDFGKQLKSAQRIAAEIKEVILHPDGRQLQHTLSNRSQYLDH